VSRYIIYPGICHKMLQSRQLGFVHLLLKESREVSICRRLV
jgi:hypothetical protein